MNRSIVFFLAIIFTVGAIQQQLITRVDFLSPWDYKNVKLSYNGKWIAYVGIYEGSPNIFVKNLPDGSPKLLTKDVKRGINSFHLLYDNKSILYEQDNDGDENYNLYAVDVETEESKIVSQVPGVRNTVLAKSHRRPYEIIVGNNKRDPAYSDVYLLDIRSGELQLIFENNYFRDFVFDDDLRLRIGYNETEMAGVTFYYFKDNGEIVVVKNVSTIDHFATKAVKINSFGIIYFIDNENVDKAGLISLDPRTMEKQQLYTAIRADVEKVYFHPKNGRPLWLYEDYAKPEMVLLDLSYEKDFKKIFNLTSSRSYFLIEISMDGQKWLVEVVSDNKPPLYYIYDKTDEGNSIQFLFSAKEKFTHYTFPPTYVYDVMTSDGLVEMCYLNFPLEFDNGNGKPIRPLPTILMPHGGPNYRDLWEFDNQLPHQLYANRDYAVLRCNFRASIGYGKTLTNAGNGEWGNKMQQDLTDAVKWSIAQNITDPNKVAIVGGSYGGYATLAGVTFTPDLYTCAIAIAAPSNLITSRVMVPKYWKPHLPTLNLQVSGNPLDGGSDEFLKSRSPLFFVDRIKTPLLIVQGDMDPRVDKFEALQIVEALKNTSVPVIYQHFPDEGHWNFRPANLLATIALGEEFLAKCLGGTHEPITDELKKSSSIIETYNVPNP